MRVVTTYINPDLDGVASALIYATHLAAEPTRTHLVGAPSPEATGVLTHLALNNALTWASPVPAPFDDIVLVDCHHPAQLPHLDDLTRVSLVIDHHPDGNAAAFPRAVIQNERVGAAATLIAERCIAARKQREVPSAHAALIAAAIASNTLDFKAPSTTDRDHHAYATLAELATPDFDLSELRNAMRKWRQDFLTLATRQVIEQNCKVIETSAGTVLVAQLEGDQASTMAGRPDLLDELARVVATKNATAGLISLVDTATNTTTLITDNEALRKSLTCMNPHILNDSTLQLPYIALRKTHLIPALTAP